MSEWEGNEEWRKDQTDAPISLKDAQVYVGRIRNARKKDYAYQYIWWCRQGCHGDPPQAKDLTVMGAQAVRLHLEPFRKQYDTSED